MAKHPRKPAESPPQPETQSSESIVPDDPPPASLEVVRNRLLTDEEWAEQRQNIVDELKLMAQDAKDTVRGLLNASDERVRAQTAFAVLGFAGIQIGNGGQSALPGATSPGLIPMETIPAVGKAMSGLFKMLLDDAKAENPDFELRVVAESDPAQPVARSRRFASGSNSGSNASGNNAGSSAISDGASNGGLRKELIGAHKHES